MNFFKRLLGKKSVPVVTVHIIDPVKLSEATAVADAFLTRQAEVRHSPAAPVRVQKVRRTDPIVVDPSNPSDLLASLKG